MVRASILLYHWFTGPVASASPEFEIAPADFRRQMLSLAHDGRALVRVRDVLAAAQGGAPLPPRSTAVTFDDAYDDFHEHALPVVAELGIPVTLFAVAGRVGGTNDWDRKRGEPQRSLMDWPRLREVAEAGVEIGSHSLTHPDLRSLSDDVLAQECRTSRMRLEDGVGRKVGLFAYPHGLYDARVKAAVRAAGYDGACAVLLRPIDLVRSDSLGLMRVIIHADRGFGNFRRRVRWAGPVHRRG